MLRECAESMADFLRTDPVFVADGNISFIVEDKAVVSFELQKAIAQTGVAVMIAVVGFNNVSQSPIAQGDIDIQLSIYENPELNREGMESMTAQAVAERLVKILHYRKFPYFIGQMIFKNFTRDDVDEANIIRETFVVHSAIGYEDRVFHPQGNTDNNN